MNLKVEIYGSSVLRKVAKPIDAGYPQLDQLTDDMFETMYHAEGVGLAAPQIGKSIQLIVIDASPMKDEYPELADFKTIIINPEITGYNTSTCKSNEGCLSVPNIREDVERPEEIDVKYYDKDFNLHEEHLDGVKARIIQHEYDHLKGVLFVDKIALIRKKMISRRLAAISKGKVNVDYKIRIPG